jgi:replicative DNA helicase
MPLLIQSGLYYKGEEMYTDTTAEWRLLSTLIDSPEILHSVTKEIFTEERQDIFDAMKSAYIKYGELTYEGLRLALKGNIPPQITSGVVANQKAIIDELVLVARRRQLRLASQELETQSKQFEPDESSILKALSFEPLAPNADYTITPGAQRMLGDLFRKTNGQYQFVHTGLKFLDSMLGGEWMPKTLTVLMAKPGTGKTALVGQSMLEMALKHNIPSMLLSLEMAKEQLVLRWVSYMLEIDSTNLLIGRINAEQRNLVEEAVIKLQQLPISVIDNPSIKLDQIKKEIKDFAQRGGRVVFLDYIQIVNHFNTGLRNYDLGEVAQALKESAKQNDVAIIALSQMNKGGGGLDGIRDSGEISQIADTVIELSPIDEFVDDTGMRGISIQFHKNRNGRLGTSSVAFNGAFQKFLV